MKSGPIVTALAGMAIALGLAGSAAGAEEEGATPHFPLKHPEHQSWTFAGPFGRWDIAQLQRGLQVYIEVCSACHGLKYVAFRNLEALGYSEDEVKAFAAGYSIEDGPNSDGDMYDRPGQPSDRFPSPFPNEEAAAFANNGAAPPDLSNMAKARAPERGFPWFVFDAFLLYAENGPDYLFSLLTGYQDPPAGAEIPETVYYNPYFGSGDALAMAPPLSDGLITYEDGSAETVDQYSRDVASFLMWAAEPHLAERKSLGLRVMVFLVVFAALLYLVKKKVWTGLKQDRQTA